MFVETPICGLLYNANPVFHRIVVAEENEDVGIQKCGKEPLLLIADDEKTVVEDVM